MLWNRVSGSNLQHGCMPHNGVKTLHDISHLTRIRIHVVFFFYKLLVNILARFISYMLYVAKETCFFLSLLCFNLWNNCFQVLILENQWFERTSTLVLLISFKTVLLYSLLCKWSPSLLLFFFFTQWSSYSYDVNNFTFWTVCNSDVVTFVSVLFSYMYFH